jgi:hypothetical protein
MCAALQHAVGSTSGTRAGVTTGRNARLAHLGALNWLSCVRVVTLSNSASGTPKTEPARRRQSRRCSCDGQFGYGRVRHPAHASITCSRSDRPQPAARVLARRRRAAPVPPEPRARHIKLLAAGSTHKGVGSHRCASPPSYSASYMNVAFGPSVGRSCLGRVHRPGTGPDDGVPVAGAGVPPRPGIQLMVARAPRSRRTVLRARPARGFGQRALMTR